MGCDNICGEEGLVSVDGAREKIDEKRRDFFCNFKNNLYLCHANAKVAQLVEHNLPKVRVAGSSPVFRSRFKASEDTEAFFVAG